MKVPAYGIVCLLHPNHLLAEKTVSIEGVEPVMLFGSNDKYLRRIESAFSDTHIVARGNQLMLKGKQEDVSHIERVIGELLLVLNRNGNLTENDLETVLDLTTAGSGLQQADAADTILFTPGGGTIKPKTPNQVQLVKEARDKDIVFAVGPAGTGKTWTAVALAVAALKSRQVKRIVLCRPAVEAGESLRSESVV